MSLEKEKRELERKKRLAKLEAERRMLRLESKLAPLTAKVELHLNEALESGVEIIFNVAGAIFGSIGSFLIAGGKTLYDNEFKKTYITDNGGVKYDYFENMKNATKKTFAKYGSRLGPNVIVTGSELTKGVASGTLLTVRRTLGF